jgi:hypothetical protein
VGVGVDEVGVRDGDEELLLGAASSSAAGFATKAMITKMSTIASTETIAMSGHIHGLRLRGSSVSSPVAGSSAAFSSCVAMAVWP